MANAGLDGGAFAVGVLALGFLLAMLAFWRMPDSPARHWLLLFGIAVFPGLAIVLGTGAAMEEAKQPTFCGSCHVMGPFIRDLQDPESSTLAAIHYQNRYIREHQCYTCHTDYDYFGPVRSKLAGLRHLWKYETGRYTTPIRLVGTYRSANCLHCHGEGKRYREQHEDIVDADTNCLDCHGPAHPAPSTR